MHLESETKTASPVLGSGFGITHPYVFRMIVPDVYLLGVLGALKAHPVCLWTVHRPLLKVRERRAPPLVSCSSLKWELATGSLAVFTRQRPYYKELPPRGNPRLLNKKMNLLNRPR